MAVETVGNVGPKGRILSWSGEVDFGLLGRAGCDDDNEPALMGWEEVEEEEEERALVAAPFDDVLLLWSV